MQAMALILIDMQQCMSMESGVALKKCTLCHSLTWQASMLK